MEITIKTYGTPVFKSRTNNALPSFPSYHEDSQNWDEKAANCARHSFVVTPPRSSRPLSIFYHSTLFLIPCNAMVRSTWNNAEYTMHIYAICVWCTKWQRGLGRMVCALTRMANEVPALVELTQPRIHCIALENNGMRFFLLSLSNSLLLRPPPFYSGSIFRFAFNSFSLSGFLRECDSSFHIFVCAPGRPRFCCSCTTSIFISCPISFLASTSRYMAFIPFFLWIFTFLTESKIIFDVRYHQYENDRMHLACSKKFGKMFVSPMYESTCAWGRNRKLVKCENRS